MVEVLYTGTLSDRQLTQLIMDCGFPPHARFLGEQLPDRLIDDAERKDLLLFNWYIPSLPFTRYTTGRIFHFEGELRWEQQNADEFQLLYLGSDHYTDVLEHHSCTLQPEFANLMREKKLKNVPKEYVLFGKRLGEDPKQLATPENHITYAEARIPRLLHYPLQVSADEKPGERVRIHATEYVDRESGCLYAYRFQTLQAMTDTSINKGA
ncbi:type III-D CRISPR-associated protein Csx19 [Dictyobacter aurantiacus]|uniref:Uncharacterized protein n=1 Tax=Dictyobacter aurantiacus TaxID=1936993 RepID=A0A401ZQZ7_9CHLR|nr:CRISPR-associated protein Csx19 [Dictyobacter aurantiacus]GCE09293.1 hypothetical protein KDAU_66220 [Dictyobacter aurantiacus]